MRIPDVVAICAYCEGFVLDRVNYSIHRDDFSIGPEVPLCDWCGAPDGPTCSQIWDKISTLSEHWSHEDDFLLGRDINMKKRRK